MVVMSAPRRKKPNRKGVPVNMFLPPEIAAALDKFMQAQEVAPKKTNVISKAVGEYLGRLGYYQLANSPPASSPPPPPVEPPTTPHLVPITPGGFKLPFVGTVAAGTPTQIFERPNEWFDFAEHFGAEGRYVFEVRGDSMADEGIRNGDYVVIRRNPEAKIGEDVVAVIDGELTLKRLLARRKAETILVSCDGKQTQYRLDETRGDRIIGVAVGSVRRRKKR